MTNPSPFSSCGGLIAGTVVGLCILAGVLIHPNAWTIPLGIAYALGFGVYVFKNWD